MRMIFMNTENDFFYLFARLFSFVLVFSLFVHVMIILPPPPPLLLFRHLRLSLLCHYPRPLRVTDFGWSPLLLLSFSLRALLHSYLFISDNASTQQSHQRSSLALLFPYRCSFSFLSPFLYTLSLFLLPPLRLLFWSLVIFLLQPKHPFTIFTNFVTPSLKRLGVIFNLGLQWKLNLRHNVILKMVWKI